MNRTPYRADYVIIGGGILGLSLAYHLSSENQSVILLEREATVGAHASGKNAGMLRHLYRHPQLTEWTIATLARLPKSIRDYAFTSAPSLIIGRDLPVHHPDYFVRSNFNLVADNDDNAARSETTPIPAVATASDGLFDSRRLMSALYELCRPRCEIVLSSAVRHLEFGRDRIDVITESGEHYCSPVVVNAAGAWVNRFMANPFLPIQCFARHLFVVEGFESDEMPVPGMGYVWDEVSEWYVRRWTQGSRLVSLCDQLPANPDADLRVLDRTLEVLDLASRFSKSANLRIGESWHCFRTYTKDKLPVWGFDPRFPGLFWLTAFGGFGMSTGFGAAYDASRVLLGSLPQSATFLIESEFGIRRLIHNVNSSPNDKISND